MKRGRNFLGTVGAVAYLFALCLGQARAQAPDLSSEDLYKKVLPSVMTLIVEKAEGQRSLGTAFMAIKDGLALTAWHVIKNGRRATVKFSNGEEFEVSGLVDKDEKRDLALIRVKVFGRPLLATEGAEPAVGSKAYVVGSPRGLEFSVSDGLVSQIQTIDGMKLFQFTCPASPGNSGGPLMNSKAQVIGIVSAQLRDSQNLNFAVPVTYALGLDATLATQLLESVKAAVTPTAAVDAKVFASVLVDAFTTQWDAIAELNRDGDKTVRTKNGFHSGVGPAIYGIQSNLQDKLKKLELMVSSDSEKEALRASITKLLRAAVEAFDYYIRAIREVGESGRWNASSVDLWNRGLGVDNTLITVGAEVLKVLSIKPYVDLLPSGLRTIGPDNTGFKLKVNSSSANSLLFLYVHKGGLADKLGLKSGDMVLSAGGNELKGVIEFKEQIKRNLGGKLKVSIKRADGTEKEMDLKIPKELPIG